jgi:hypothetical protein
VSLRPFAAHGQPAVHKGIAFDARLRFLRQQQAQLELQLTKPGLSAAATTRLERQKAYWGHAIERMLDSSSVRAALHLRRVGSSRQSFTGSSHL